MWSNVLDVSTNENIVLKMTKKSCNLHLKLNVVIYMQPFQLVASAEGAKQWICSRTTTNLYAWIITPLSPFTVINNGLYNNYHPSIQKM